MPNDMQTLGRMIRQTRLFHRLTQQEMAARTGMSQKKYSRIECGEVADPGLADMTAIGRVLGLTLNQMAYTAGLLTAIDLRQQAA